MKLSPLTRENLGVPYVPLDSSESGQKNSGKSSPDATPRSSGTSAMRLIAPLATGFILFLIPVPAGLSANAWHYFALFAAVVVSLITEPVPSSITGLMGVSIGAVSGLVYSEPAKATAWALSGFGNSTVWLIFSAYMFALGYAKTGLGKRIALLLIRVMGRRTLGLGYAVALSDLILAPLMPSNTARCGGTVYPIIRHIPELYGSKPNDPSSRKIGAYILYTAIATTCVTSSMFLTALAPNILAVAIASKTIGIHVSWIDWFKGFAPAGIVLFFIVPALLYKIYPPEIKEAPEASRWAAEELVSLGSITKKEIHLLFLVTSALIVWIFGAKFVDPTIAAILAVVGMVFAKIVTWKEATEHYQAWDVFVYFSTLLTMAGGLVDTKFVDWVAKAIAAHFDGLGTIAALLLLVGSFFLLHYLFASITAHTSALLPVFLTVGVTIPGVSKLGVTLLLGYALGLFGIISPYGTGASPIYYSAGYIQRKDFWLYGLILGIIFFVAEVAITIPWLAYLKM